MVLVVVKAGTVGTVKPVGGAHAGEAVDHEHIAHAACHLAQAQRLARETAAAVVHGDNTVGMYLIIVDAHAVLRTTGGGDLLEGAVQSHTLTHDEGRGIGIVAQLVVGRIPREQVMAFVGLGDGKGVDGQRLHDIGAVVALGDELQHTFINGAAHVEAEHRVEAVLHVGKVLVREQFHQHSGHLGHACLVITLVPHAAARPVGLPLGSDVLDNLGREQVAETARQLARRAVGILAELLATGAGAIDQQRAHD